MRQIIFITIICLLAAQPASAQFGKLLNKALERKAQEKVDKKVEEALDKAFENDSVFTKNKNGKTVIETQEAEITIEQDNTPVGEVAASKFIGSYVTTSSMSENGQPKEEIMKMHIFIDSYQVAMVMQPEKGSEEPPSRIIFDRRTQTMTTLMEEKDGQKTGVKMKKPKINLKDKTGDKQQQTATKNKPIRTNETKQISGYTCNKYTKTDEKYDYEFWVAESIDLDPTVLLDAISMSPAGENNSMQDNTGFAKGIAMEVITRDKKSKKNETLTMTISNFKMGSVDKNMFSTNGYEIQDMTNMPFFRGGK